jgi:hypothetical protein
VIQTGSRRLTFPSEHVCILRDEVSPGRASPPECDIGSERDGRYLRDLRTKRRRTQTLCDGKGIQSSSSRSWMPLWLAPTCSASSGKLQPIKDGSERILIRQNGTSRYQEVDALVPSGLAVFQVMSRAKRPDKIPQLVQDSASIQRTRSGVSESGDWIEQTSPCVSFEAHHSYYVQGVQVTP